MDTIDHKLDRCGENLLECERAHHRELKGTNGS